MVQVYTVVYYGGKNKNYQGAFLLARKLKKGYFFADSEAVVPEGAILNNSDGYAFPGGRRDVEDANIMEAALREFREETGVDLSKGEIFTEVKRWGKFAALYVPVPASQGFEGMAAYINKKSLPEARQNAQLVQKGAIDYATIAENAKTNKDGEGYPLSDELESVNQWNVTNKSNWQEILGWENTDIGWLYTILLYLKTRILALPKDFVR